MTEFSTIKKITSLMVSTFLCYSPSYAQQVQELFKLDIEDLLDIKITSSTLTDETILSVPASITVFTRTQIKQLGVRTVDELINYVPGYQSSIYDDTHLTSASRSRRIANASREILVVLDGQRLNHEIFGVANGFYDRLPIENIERVEFIRGPGSAIYGANAFLGVVNIVTSTNLNHVTLTSDDSLKKTFNGAFSHGFENGLKTALFLHHITGDDKSRELYDSIDDTFDTSHVNYDTQLAYLRATWGDWSMVISKFVHNYSGGYSLGGVNDQYNYTKIDSGIYSLQYQHSFSDKWVLTSRIYETPYFYSPRLQIANSPLRISTSEYLGRERGLDNLLSWHDGDAKVLVGFNLIQNIVDRAENYSWLPPSDPLPSVRGLELGLRKVTGIYGQWQDNLSQDLSYILGIRKDYYSDINGHTSPRYGLIWKANQTNVFKLLYGEAFRAPARNELYIQNNARQIGNPNLKPEIAKTKEFIFIHTENDYYLSSTLFDTLITDAVVLDASIQPGSWINQGTQYMSGVELEFKWFLNSMWQIHGDLTHMLNSPFDYNREAEDMFGLRLLFQQDDWNVRLSGRYYGERRDVNSSEPGFTKIASYTLFDFFAMYELNDDWQTSLTIRNIFEREAYYAAINANNYIGVPGYGREIELGVSWGVD